jgi:capsule polysaccharide modification protein KpsS
MDYKRSARQEATRFVESRISYLEDNPIQDFSSLSSKLVLEFFYSRH